MVFRVTAIRSLRSIPHPPTRPTLLLKPTSLRSLSTTPRRLASTNPNPNPNPNSDQDPPPPPPNDKDPKQKPKSENTNAPPRSPWQVFIQTLKEEIEANKGWQDNVKQLKGEVDKMADSAALKKGRDVYEKTRISNLIRDNPRIQSAARSLGAAGMSMSEATSRALNDTGVLSAINRVNGTLGFLGDSIADTIVYKGLAAGLQEAVGDVPVADGYERREARLARREARARKAGKSRRVKANPDAGEALVATSESTPDTPRLGFVTSSPTYQRIKENYYESEEPIYSAMRSVGRVFTWINKENDMARVTKSIKEIDLDFTLEGFRRELKEYIIPELTEGWVEADREMLKPWLGEAVYNVVTAVFGEYRKKHLVPSSQIIEISEVEIQKGQFVNEEIPSYLITWMTQETECWRKGTQWDEVVVGSPDVVLKVRYAIAITRVAENVDDEVTGGWKIIEMVRAPLPR